MLIFVNLLARRGPTWVPNRLFHAFELTNMGILRFHAKGLVSIRHCCSSLTKKRTLWTYMAMES